MSLSGVALVTGGAGFIGSHIAAGLIDRGARVRIIDDLSTGHRENIAEIGGDVDFIQASLTDPKAVNRALQNVEWVFHEAAIPSVPRSVAQPAETHEASVNATFSLLNMRPDPLSPYAVAKLVGEYYCQVFSRVYGLETISLRYFNVFGPRQDPGSQYSGVISRFIDSLLSGKQPTIYGDGEQSRDFTYISNVVDANLRAAESDLAVGHVINIANGERVTINEVFEMVKKLTGRTNLHAEHAPARAGDVRDSLADLALARSVLAYSPHVGLEDGLRATIEWWTSSRFSKAAS